MIERPEILPVIQAYVSLRRCGREHRGLCPFHSEKTPSFTVNADKGLFHCFACGFGGDVIRFIEKIEGLDFRGALAFLGLTSGSPGPTCRQIEERRQQNATAGAIASWALDMSARITARLRDIGDRGDIARKVLSLPSADKEFLRSEIERLRREWLILTGLQDDLLSGDHTLEVWQQREAVENIIGDQEPYSAAELEAAYPPLAESYLNRIREYVKE